jgi:hypothetical protein
MVAVFTAPGTAQSVPALASASNVAALKAGGGNATAERGNALVEDVRYWRRRGFYYGPQVYGYGPRVYGYVYRPYYRPYYQPYYYGSYDPYYSPYYRPYYSGYPGYWGRRAGVYFGFGF